MEDRDFVTLIDEDGYETIYEFIDTVEIDEQKYVLLVEEYELDKDDEDQQLTILRVEEDEDGEEILVDILDEDEWEWVVEYIVDLGIGIRKELH